MTATAQALDTVVGAFVAELARAGVRHVCACPGSRSAPLAIKLAQHPDIRLWMHLDERSAAYFGLGLAKAMRQPVALLATSGTAAANFLPAVVEAFLARVPLVVLTADRPHELRDVGAAQTIDQQRLYGEHVKWFFDLPEPAASLSPEHVRLVRTLAARAVGTALAEPAGPVHLNWPFREPLIPEAHASATPAVWGARAGGRPYVDVSNGRLAPSNDLVATLADDLSKSPRGLIVCGPQDDPELPSALARLAERLGFPILADPLSGLRRGAHDRSLVVDAYDAFLRHASTVEQLAPEVVLRFGALPTSKSMLLYLQQYAPARQIVVDPGGWREPTGLASDMLHVDPRLLCDALASTSTRPDARSTWAATWLDINAVTRQSIAHQMHGLGELFEGKVFSAIPALLPQGALLYAGNSMPVRDLDTFLPAAAESLRCLSNRGANGVDGVVSSALGASAAGVGPVVLVVGDVSFYHDLNGLLAARKYALDLLVVLVNNDGGGIFSFLPQADLPTDEFETLFGTPHGLDFRPFVEGFGGRFTRVADWPGFLSAVRDGLERGGLNTVEVPTDRARNVVLHREVWRGVAEALGSAGALMRLNGLEFNVEIDGSGPPLLVLHGFTGSARAWDEVRPEVAGFARGIFIDAIGHGRSAAPPQTERYSLDWSTRDLTALLDALEIDTVNLLGYSMGGRAALHFAVHAPDRVRKLILESASPGLEDEHERRQRAEADNALADRILHAGIEAFVAEWERQPLLQPAQHVSAAARAVQRAQRLKNNPLGLANSLRGMGTGQQEFLWSRLPELKQPVLLIVGDHDHRYRQIAERMQTLLPCAELAVVPDAGHTVHQDQPAQFVDLVKSVVDQPALTTN